MIDIKEQIKKISLSKKEEFDKMMEAIPEGRQKSFLSETIKRLNNGNMIDTEAFIKKLSEIKGENIDLDKLKSIQKEFSRTTNVS